MRKQIKVMFPGTFNPIHEGHLDIINRCAKNFDVVYVVVSQNRYKRKTDISATYKSVKKVVDKLHLKNVIVAKNEKLTVDFAEQHNIRFIVRSIRNSKDAEYEMNMARANHALSHDIETILMLPRKELINLSSTAVRFLIDAKKRQ